MIVKKINLKNFRNYKRAEIDFNENINIIYGNNAQGKTNILEGIYLFSLGKSNRAQKDDEMINFDENEASLELNFFSKERDKFGKIELNRKKRKKIFLNEIPVKRNSDLVGSLNVVFFGPEYLSLVREGPKNRRKNLDILISQLKVQYMNSLSDYKKLIEQKSALLKDDKKDKIFLSVLNEKIIALSVYLIKTRFLYIKKIEEISKKIQLEISEGKENLELEYISCGMNIDENKIKNLEEILKKKAEEMFHREEKYFECIFGPHRDDIDFKINGQSLKLFGSQGQQKTAVLVQKIAEVELFREEIGEYPVLLLDDIMSELDSQRQDFVLNKLSNMQIFITCTDAERLKVLKDANFIEIEKGSMKKCTCI
ncbi:MAG: DNA replication/repair protein RecF [Clostridia bacterium]|nr:DNA replication/repair protein RecF [Clostridia bacterium]